MSSIPSGIVEAIANRLANLLKPTLQNRLHDSVGSFFESMGGKGGLSSVRSAMDTWNTPVGGGDASHSGSSPAGSRTPPPSREKPSSIVSRISEFFGERSVEKTQQQSGQSWWQRGWGSKTSNGQKRGSFARGARLREIAQKRFNVASRAVKASSKQKGNPGWHPAAHGQLLANKRAAAQRLAQASSLQAKATGLSAISGTKVAGALAGLAGKLPMLASRLALPVAIATTIARIPWMVKSFNDSRIEMQRDGARFSGVIAAAMAKYDVRSANLSAITARDTEKSTEFLVNQQIKLKKTLQPFEAMGTNVLNTGGGWAAGALNELGKQKQGNLDVIEAMGNAVSSWFKRDGFDYKKEFDKIQQDRKQKEKDDELLFGNRLGETAGVWVKSMEHIQAARGNNQPIQPIPTVK